MDLLALRARAGWSAARAGRGLLLDPKTLASWARCLDEHGPGALLAPRKPVNAFDDAITDLVHRLHAAAPTLARRQLANVLLRGGLRLAASTVRRRLRRPRPLPPTAPSAAPGSETSGARAAASASLPAAPAPSPAEPPRAARTVTACRRPPETAEI